MALVAAGGAGLSTSPAVAGEAPQQEPTDETPQAEFTGAYGYGVAVAMSADGGTAVVGQLGESKSTDVPGVAHVFTLDRTRWKQQAELTASDSSYDNLFGNAVAVNAGGNTVIVGDPGECGYGLENCEHGVAYVFTRSGSTWTQQAELHGGPGFGGAVALSSDGNTALVGAGLSGYYGVSYALGGNAPPTIFSRSGTTWTQEATLSATNASGPFDNFGHSVALSADGDTALIGDPTENEEAGAAYVFTGSGSTWTEQAELTGSDETSESKFGTSVALSAAGETAIVGAPAQNGGSAYVFTGSGSTWAQQAELTPDDAEVSSFDGWFGMTVALDGEGTVALVGAPWAEEDLGAAYAFAGEGSDWAQQGEFVVDNATPYDYFGDAVALNGAGTTALIGRYDPGAYFFGIPVAHFAEHPVNAEPPLSTKPIGTTTGPAQTPNPGAGQTSTTPPPAGVMPTRSGVPAAVLAKVVSEVVSPTAFAAAPRGAGALAARSRYGATVTYELNTTGDVRFTVVEVQRGRDTPAGRCVKPTKTKREVGSCARLVTLPGGFTLAGKAGLNQFRFTGRLDGRKLAVGSYELLATPIAADPARHSATASFSIIK
jgi:hypothetical protein